MDFRKAGQFDSDGASVVASGGLAGLDLRPKGQNHSIAHSKRALMNASSRSAMLPILPRREDSGEAIGQ